MSVQMMSSYGWNLRYFASIDRTQKLKDARSEAARDLEAYKAKKDTELKEFEAKVLI